MSRMAGIGECRGSRLQALQIRNSLLIGDGEQHDVAALLGAPGSASNTTNAQLNFQSMCDSSDDIPGSNGTCARAPSEVRVRQAIDHRAVMLELRGRKSRDLALVVPAAQSHRLLVKALALEARCLNRGHRTALQFQGRHGSLAQL